MNKRELLIQKSSIYKKMRDNPKSALKILKEEQEKLLKSNIIDNSQNSKKK